MARGGSLVHAGLRVRRPRLRRATRQGWARRGDRGRRGRRDGAGRDGLPGGHGAPRGAPRDGGRPGARRHRGGWRPRDRHRARLRRGRGDPLRGDALPEGHRAKETGVKRPVRVGIVLGSDSDLEVMLEAVKVLDALEVGSEVVVTSAHRTPARTHEYATTAHARGIGVLIAGAGGAAALPGVLAASSPLPVIGVPVASTPLGGLDALLSISQMPKGVPVATVAIGKWGAANAGLLAAQLLAVGDPALAARIAAHRNRLADDAGERP